MKNFLICQVLVLLSLPAYGNIPSPERSSEYEDLSLFICWAKFDSYGSKEDLSKTYNKIYANNAEEARVIAQTRALSYLDMVKATSSLVLEEEAKEFKRYASKLNNVDCIFDGGGFD